MNQKRASLPTLLTTLTILALFFQMSLFVINNKVNSLLDSLVRSSLATQIFHPVIVLPLLGFFLTQIISYFLFVCALWFITSSAGQRLNFSETKIYYMGIFLWVLAILDILLINNQFFSDSFFAVLLRGYGWNHPHADLILIIIFSVILILSTLTAYINMFATHKRLILGFLFLGIFIGSLFLSFYTYFFTKSDIIASQATDQPNIIFIGLDSVRPDYTGFFGNKNINTPHIDQFLKTSTVFSEAYTPLARTFPAWMSILTGKYPKHNHVRINLADSELIKNEDTIAKHLQKAGYETIYGTDEKRFSNILPEYGFDKIMGPDMGVNDFLIGGLSDFPLTNLLINTPIGRIIFPYNYANRAANITYMPTSFLQLVKIALAGKHNKPLFLAMHLCVSHWPYTWSNDKEDESFTQAERYKTSVEAVDQQLNDLLSILKNDGFLNHTIVVLLSDHGTTVGLPHDRIISRNTYSGDPDRISWIPFFTGETSHAFLKPHSLPSVRLDTSYGQGTDVLSLKQYHVVLAIKGFGVSIPSQTISSRSSLLDIAPTILDFLKLPPLQSIDGISLSDVTLKKINENDTRALFLETGFKVPGIEESQISTAKVVKQAIHIFKINPHTGLLYVNPLLEEGLDLLKQRAVLSGNWLLARYPDEDLKKLVPDPVHPGFFIFQSTKIPPYFVIANIQNGNWSIGLDSPMAKQAPIQNLLNEFNQFYGDEIEN